MSDRERWAETRLEARIWWCGDEVCDCTQPQIDRITPNLESGYPWIRREPVWRGTFYSNGDDRSGQMDELRAAALERGIRLEIIEAGAP